MLDRSGPWRRKPEIWTLSAEKASSQRILNSGLGKLIVNRRGPRCRPSWPPHKVLPLSGLPVVATTRFDVLKVAGIEDDVDGNGVAGTLPRVARGRHGCPPRTCTPPLM